MGILYTNISQSKRSKNILLKEDHRDDGITKMRLETFKEKVISKLQICRKAIDGRGNVVEMC